jgi:hypothetical protein
VLTFASSAGSTATTRTSSSALEDRERRTAVGTGKWARARDGDVGAGVGEGTERVGADVRAVDGEDDADVVPSGTQPGHQAGERRPCRGAVVDERKGEREPVAALSHGQPLVARLAEHPPGTLGERLAVEPCERLRRAEPPARAAHEQDARHLSSTRHACE